MRSLDCRLILIRIYSINIFLWFCSMSCPAPDHRQNTVCEVFECGIDFGERARGLDDVEVAVEGISQPIWVLLSSIQASGV